MGRESKVRKERVIKKSGTKVYATAEELKERG